MVTAMNAPAFTFSGIGDKIRPMLGKDTEALKHIFVINPEAGTRSEEPFLRERLRAYADAADIRVYVTKARGDASDYIRLCRAREEGMLRFYACGGDGTSTRSSTGRTGSVRWRWAVPAGAGTIL